MEIITGAERRRRWRAEDTLRIVSEAEGPCACFAEEARRHDVSRALLWTWRRQVRESMRRSGGANAFLPVHVVAEAPAAVGVVVAAEPGVGRTRRSARRPVGAEAGLIEIALPDGTMVRVGRDVGAAARAGRAGRVIPISANVRVWLATGTTDMRRGMNGLALQVQEALARDPHAGDLYVFRGKRGDLIKVLWHDGLGMSLYAKRLERGRFVWPSPADGMEPVTAAQLGYMLVGIDWRHPQRT